MDPADSCTPGIATTDGRLSARSLTGVGKPPRYGPTVPWAASARACSRVSGAFQYDGVAGRPHHGGEMPKTQRAGAFARILAIVVTVVIGSAMHAQAQKIGRASCRERVERSGGAVSGQNRAR